MYMGDSCRDDRFTYMKVASMAIVTIIVTEGHEILLNSLLGAAVLTLIKPSMYQKHVISDNRRSLVITMCLNSKGLVFNLHFHNR